MKKDEKLKALFDRFDNNIINDIQTQLDEELSKSDKDFNPDKVAELTAVIAQIKGGTLTEERKLNNIEQITDAVMADRKRSQINRIFKALSTICACLVIVIGLNIYTMNTFGDDLFSAAIKAAQNGFSLDFSGNDENTPPNEDETTGTVTTTAEYEENDGTTTVTETATESPVTETEQNAQPVTETSQEGLNATTVCTTQDIQDSATTAEDTATYPANTQVSTEDSISTSTVPCSPDDNTDISGYINDVCSNNNVSACNIDNSFMPLMQEAESEIEYTQYSTDIYFHFTTDNTRMDIIIENYHNKKDIPEMLIPSTSMNYEIISIPCGTAFLFTENDIITAVFSQGSTVYTITGQSSEDNISDIIKTAAKGFIPDTEN